MAIPTQKYVRKPLYVDAVCVTEENFLEIAFWCQGSIKNNDGSESKAGEQIDPRRQHIQVRVHNPKTSRQTKAMVGDWILYTDRGYKVYTEKAFRSSFDLVPAVEEEEPKEEPKGESTEEDAAA